MWHAGHTSHHNMLPWCLYWHFHSQWEGLVLGLYLFFIVVFFSMKLILYSENPSKLILHILLVRWHLNWRVDWLDGRAEWIVRVLSTPAGGTGDISSIERLDGTIPWVIPSCWQPIDEDFHFTNIFQYFLKWMCWLSFSAYNSLFSPIGTRECARLNLSLSTDMYKGCLPI